MTELHAALQVEAAREMARRNFLDYCRLIDGKYQTPAHIVNLADLLTRVDSGEISKLAISAPPRFGKSKLLAHFASFWLHRSEDRHLLLLSAGEKVSRRNSGWIRTDVRSENYPWPVAISDESSSILHWKTSAGSSVSAYSSGSVITGVQADLAILDDVQATTMTLQTRDTLEEWLRGVMETRLEPNAPMILINSRWSTDDIYSRLQQGEDGDAWLFVNLEAICETQPDPIGRKIGESLWESRWSVPLLQAKKKAVGSMVWEASYQGHPSPEGGRLFRISDLKTYEILPSPPEVAYDPYSRFFQSPLDAARAPVTPFITVTAIDTKGVSLSTSTGSYSALVSAMFDSGTGNIYITDAERSRCPYDDLRTMTLRHLERNKPDLVIVEEAAMGGRLGMDLTRSTRWPVQFTQPKLSKEERAIEILPLCEGGKVFLPAHGRFRDLEKELADFPAGTTDLADCFVYCLQYCKLARARLRDDELWNEQIKRLEGGWMLR